MWVDFNTKLGYKETMNKGMTMSDEPQLAGMIPLSTLAEFLRDWLTVEVSLFEKPYSEGHLTTEVTIMLGNTVITRGSDSYKLL